MPRCVCVCLEKLGERLHSGMWKGRRVRMEMNSISEINTVMMDPPCSFWKRERERKGLPLRGEGSHRANTLAASESTLFTSGLTL